MFGGFLKKPGVAERGLTLLASSQGVWVRAGKLGLEVTPVLPLSTRKLCGGWP